MAVLKITAPAGDFSGDFAGVYFRAGVATVDDADPSVAAALAYCRRRGYTVEPAGTAEVATEPAEVNTELARPRGYASKSDWVAYAIQHPDPTRRLSDASANGMTKQELVDLFSDNTSNEEELS